MGQCERIKGAVKPPSETKWIQHFAFITMTVKKQINIAPNLNVVQHQYQTLHVPVLCPDSCFLLDKSMWYYKRQNHFFIIESVLFEILHMTWINKSKQNKIHCLPVLGCSVHLECSCEIMSSKLSKIQ